MAVTSSSAKILVTGGTGYIGSHTCIELIERGLEPIIVDNLCNSHPAVVDRITSITNHRPAFYQEDVRDVGAIKRICGEHQISAAIHFAGLKAVGESQQQPLAYYLNNVSGSLSLVEALCEVGVKRLIFSSSATVYGIPDVVPVSESAAIRPTNPYGETKAIVERTLEDIHRADRAWRIGILRYFNPVGAHESGLIGENPNGVPNNLMPFISQVAVGRHGSLRIFGNNYPTPDGTGIRDYIHVMDLAEAHVAALNYLFHNEELFSVNVGTGRGHSVLEVIEAFVKASGRSVPYQVVERRKGDVAACYADVNLSRKLLGWHAHRSLEQMCADSWRWQSANPNGYDSILN